jgi:hypothetical protein
MAGDLRKVEINIQKIPVGGSLGAAAVIVVLLTVLFLALPGIRPTAIGGIAAGLIFAVALIRWRR